MRRLGTLAALAGVALTLAACGADDPRATGAGAQSAQAAKVRTQVGQLKGTKVGHAGSRRARFNEGSTAPTGVAPTGAGRPCSLVTRAEAQAIMRQRVLKPIEATQGPTCVYRYGAKKRILTLAVEPLDVKQIQRQARDSDTVKVAGKTGVCVRSGSVLYVPLAGNRSLTVSAPCLVAQNFAAIALKRLAA
jgi:hypothetical protein